MNGLHDDLKIIFLYKDINTDLIFDYFDCLDYSYFKHKNIKIECVHWDNIDSILNDKNILFLFVVELLIRFDNLDDYIKILNKFTIPVIYFDIRFPQIYKNSREYSLQLQKLENTNIHVITDYIYDDSKNLIGNPLLGLHNFEEHFFHSYHHTKYDKSFISSTYDEFLKREYDVMLKIGKPKNYIRNLLLLLYNKHNLNNSFQCCSFSQEIGENMHNNISIKNYYEIINDKSAKIIDRFSLQPEFQKINFGTYLGATYRKGNVFDNIIGKNYIVDFNSYSEIYFESITSNPENLKYPKLVSFTEKTFKIFYTYKFPLAVDTKANIDYLKNLGFEFQFEPCILESTDTIESLYNKFDIWLSKLKNVDFEKEWKREMSELKSSLHNNARLCNHLMKQTEFDIKNSNSIPTYLTTYQLFDLFHKNMLKDYINWNYQSYLFIKEKNLI